MSTVSATAYPQLSLTVSDRELREVYTPTQEERDLAQQHTTGRVAEVALLVLLKVFQRLGYPVPLTSVPAVIVHYIATDLGQPVSTADLVGYDASGTRRRHLRLVRHYLGITAYGPEAHQALEAAMREAALSKDAPEDLINIAIEELVRQQFELPALSTMERAAFEMRAEVNRTFYDHIHHALTAADCQQLDQLFLVPPDERESAWNRLKDDPGRPTLTNLKAHLEHLAWLKGLQVSTTALAGIPDVKRKRFAAEAQTLDAARMQAMQARKRYTLTLCLLVERYAQALDDLAEMVIKRLLKLHQHSKTAFETYCAAHQGRVNELIGMLRDVTQAYQAEGTAEARLHQIDRAFGGQSAAVLRDCEQHLASVSNTYYPFLPAFYGAHRTTLFKFLHAVTLRSSHQNTGLEEAIAFLLANEHRTGDWLPICRKERQPKQPPRLVPLLDLSWMSDIWWRVVSGQRKRTPSPEKVKRQLFELCVFTQILWDLKTGDLYIEGSDLYANTWAQGISWEQYAEQVADYGKMLAFPVDGPGFVVHLRAWLEQTVREVDAAFPRSQVTIEGGEPIIHRPLPNASPRGLKALEALLAERLEPVSLLDMLADVQYWLEWCQEFGPISGFETRLEDAVERYLITVFAYGTQLGPTQTAKSLPDLDRKQIAWVHQRHITEASLDAAITRIINAYARFDLPRRWGSGKRASADGTKWEIHIQNLLAEYHIRYGGYGGIGYYHVSDTYIALFSHFIPCGVWEAVYILDGLLKNVSDLQPDEVAGDTQAQNTVVFGLAHLLGIRLMPRIRNLKDLTLYRPSTTSTYEHIDALFQDTIDLGPHHHPPAGYAADCALHQSRDDDCFDHPAQAEHL